MDFGFAERTTDADHGAMPNWARFQRRSAPHHRIQRHRCELFRSEHRESGIRFFEGDDFARLQVPRREERLHD